MLLRIPLGIFSDKIGKRKIFIILGILFSFFSSLGMGFFKIPKTLLIFRSMSGVAATAWVTFVVLFSSYFEGEDAPKAVGFIMSITTLGQVSGTFAGGIITEQFGYKATFIIASISAVIGIVTSFGITERKPVTSQPLKLESLIETIKNRELILFSFLAILVQFINFSTVYGFTPVAAKQIGANDFQLGLLTTLSAIPGVLAAALSGAFFMEKLGKRKTLLIGFAVTSLTCIAIPYIKDLKILYATQIIGGFCRGGLIPLLMGLSIKNIDGNKRATATGFFQAAYGIGMFIGPVITGVLGDTKGLVWGFWTVGFVGAAGAIVSAVCTDRNA
jgi:MFS family permease